MKRLLIALVLGSLSHSAAAQTVDVKAARLFDGRSEPLRSNVAVAVAGGKITAIVGAASVPAGASVIDLGSRTLMPGLIDAHTHVALHPGDYESQILRETPEFRAIWSTQCKAEGGRRKAEGGSVTMNSSFRLPPSAFGTPPRSNAR